MQTTSPGGREPVSLLRPDVLIVIAAAAAVVALSMGMRQAFGLFMPAVSEALGGGRGMFGLAIALQNLLWGMAQPGVGMLADRFGSRIVTACGGLIYALGLAATALATSALLLNLSLGLLVGMGLSATAIVVVLGAVARAVPAAKRGLAFGIVTSAGSFGMFAVVPVGHGLLASMSWQNAFFAMAALALLMTLLAWGFPRGARTTEAHHDGTLGESLRAASRHRGYWLLNAGFFVCGFHVAFIATHLPAYLVDSGLAAGIGAATLALIGLFNMIGSLTFGMLADRFSKPRVLSALYGGRVLVIVAFLLIPLTPASALIFSAAIGFLWLGTIPPTSGLVAQIFGPRYLGSLFGIVFLSHQVGSFAGAWLGGYVHDTTGSYNAVWIMAIALGLLATALHLPISDKPVTRERPAAA